MEIELKHLVERDKELDGKSRLRVLRHIAYVQEAIDEKRLEKAREELMVV